MQSPDLADLAAKHPITEAWFHELAATPPPDASVIAALSVAVRAGKHVPLK